MKKKIKKVKSGDPIIDNLYNAVVAYVAKHNGTAVVIGGISLFQDIPGSFNYGILVRCTGKLPVFERKV